MTNVLRQFLLRQTDADFTERLEEAILTETGLAERLREEEFDLLDDYAASRLNAEDAAAVEQYLLATVEDRESLRIARALQREARQPEPRHPEARQPLAPGPRVPETPVLEPAVPELPATALPPPRTPRRASAQRLSVTSMLIAASVAALVIVPAWLLTRDPPHARASPESSIAVPFVISSPDQAPHTVPAVEPPVITLLADVSRGAERPTLKVIANASSVRLQVEVPAQSPVSLYAVEIRDPSGRELFKKRGLAVQIAGPYRFVEAEIPVPALAPGDRTVVLTSDAAEHAAPEFKWRVTAILTAPSPDSGAAKR
jgi:hypothetical protein